MNAKSKIEIHEFARTLWPDVEKLEVSVCPQRAEITVSNTYSAPGLSFSHLKKLSEFFDTDNINDDARFNHGGCDTCDYGSEYGFTLTIRPE